MAFSWNDNLVTMNVSSLKTSRKIKYITEKYEYFLGNDGYIIIIFIIIIKKIVGNARLGESV